MAEPPDRPLLPPATIGIIGGGQLGRMSALAARAMGYRVVVLEPREPCACTGVVNEQIVADYGDAAALARLFARSDAVTFEFENVPDAPLAEARGSVPVRPDPSVLAICRDRTRERAFLAEHGFPHAPYLLCGESAPLPGELDSFRFPGFLKAAGGGYDGKGQVRVERREDWDAAWAGLGTPSAVLEEAIPFTGEYSVIVARGADGETTTYPLCHNLHRDRILEQTWCPAGLEVEEEALADALAVAIAEKLGLVGVLAVELFRRGPGDWLVNELAPRPHNSGHFSLNGSDTSQFENHVRTVCGLPLGSTHGLGPAAMQNLLGEDLPAAGERLAPAVAAVPGAHLHLYDKGEARPGRKMGHINVLAEHEEERRRRMAAVRRILGRD